MSEYITGIQQIGIGVTDADEAKYLYRDLFGMNALVFDDEAAASLMTTYTGHKIYKRRALLTMNMNGGGGFEIWQFLNRTPALQQHEFIKGTPGINAIKIKSRYIDTAYDYLSKCPGIQIGSKRINPDHQTSFDVTDRYGNHFEVIEGADWFSKNNHCLGGVAGAVIGVTDMEKSLNFYRLILGSPGMVYDVTETAVMNGVEVIIRKVLLRKATPQTGAFARLLGSTDIELVQLLNMQPDHLYKDRYWGDCGFIHICFDVTDMDQLKNLMESNGYPFTVDSAVGFNMQHAAGRFCYVEDPDGTLIELVQTHKVPVLKKLGWYINLTKRNTDKPLPNWMVSMLGLNKVK